jgi:hypothetical protein
MNPGMETRKICVAIKPVSRLFPAISIKIKYKIYEQANGFSYRGKTKIAAGDKQPG